MTRRSRSRPPLRGRMARSGRPAGRGHHAHGDRLGDGPAADAGDRPLSAAVLRGAPRADPAAGLPDPAGAQGRGPPDGAVVRHRPRGALGAGLRLCRGRLPLARAADLLAPAGDLAPRHRHRPPHARGAPARHRLGAGHHHLRVPALCAVRRHGPRTAPGPAAELAAPRGLHGGRFRTASSACRSRSRRPWWWPSSCSARSSASPAARSSSPTPR